MNRLRTLDEEGREVPSPLDQISAEEAEEIRRLLCDHSQGNRGSYSVRSDKKIPNVVNAPIPDCALHYSHGTEYYNGTRKTVTVGDRTGLRITLTANTVHERQYVGSIVQGYFVVRVRRTLNYGAFATLADLWNSDGTALHSLECEPLSDGMVLHKALRNKDVNQGSHRMSVTLEYRFAEEEFTSSGGNLYCPELDLVLSILEPEVVPPHPYNLIGNRQLMFKEDPAMRALIGFQYRLLIIDNAQRLGDRFLYLNGNIHHIRPERSGILRDGAWLFTSPPVKDNLVVPTEATARWIPLEEMDSELHLYRTYEEALTKGTPDARAEQLEREKQDYNLEIVREKRARLDAERALATEAHERAREMAEYQRQFAMLKDHYELRSHQRKATLDWLKFIPAVLTGAVGMVLAIFKLFTSPS